MTMNDNPQPDTSTVDEQDEFFARAEAADTIDLDEIERYEAATVKGNE